MESEASENEVAETEAAVVDLSHMKWYAVGTLSGYEKRAHLLLTENIKNSGMQEFFGELLVPTEEVVEVRAGARRTVQRKLMPGYMFIQMNLTNEAWHVVKDTQKIIGFIGDDKNPKPMSKREVARLTKHVEEGTVRPKAAAVYEEGTNVRVIDGPFLNFNGVVEETMPQKQKVRVLVSIFGRQTPVELDFTQVEKT